MDMYNYKACTTTRYQRKKKPSLSPFPRDAVAGALQQVGMERRDSGHARLTKPSTLSLIHI